jgi:drug/metabolite transporter (DMT)-like permease
MTNKTASRFSNTFLALTFVLIWGSGFVATKIALQYTSPFVFLTIRYGLGVACLALFAITTPFVWPKTPKAWLHVIVAGLLMHAVYLGGSHYAQYLGMAAGTAALILATQPLITAFIAAIWMLERLRPRQWLGVVIGLAGVVLVVWHNLDVHAITAGSLIAVAMSLTGIVAGTLYQRTFNARVDLRTASFIQFAACLVALAPLALIVEGWHVIWSWQLIASAAFLVIGASIIALNAFHILMRRGQATRVAGLVYLTPIVAVVLEFLVFRVVPSGLSFVGMATVCVGVALLSSAR